jgi:hypothetical protein
MRPRCASCGDWTHPPEGVYLTLVAKGRTICDGCGRFQLYCPCVPASQRAKAA